MPKKAVAVELNAQIGKTRADVIVLNWFFRRSGMGCRQAHGLINPGHHDCPQNHFR